MLCIQALSYPWPFVYLGLVFCSCVGTPVGEVVSLLQKEALPPPEISLDPGLQTLWQKGASVQRVQISLLTVTAYVVPYDASASCQPHMGTVTVQDLPRDGSFLFPLT